MMLQNRAPAQGLNPGATSLETGPSSGLLASPLPAPINTAKFKTVWEDPPDFNVNWVESTVRWWKDTTDDVVVYDSGLCRWWRLALTGWIDEGGTCEVAYGPNQWTVMVDATRDFDNDIFPCVVGRGAETHYHPNRVGGSLYGSFGQSTTWATGDCEFLLSHHTLLY